MKTNQQKRKTKPEIAVIMGSDSDWQAMQASVKVLTEFNLAFEVSVISAHRSPARAIEYAGHAKSRGIQIIIAAAGGAAHLAGVLAAHTTLPVIGVPMKSNTLDGLDALLSTVQMPAGVPVATVALGSAGPVNAAVLAVQILSLNRKALANALQRYKQQLETKVNTAHQRVQKELVTL